MMQHAQIRIYGRVQGVLFRFSTREKAKELGVTGFAQNMPDGSVYVEVEGEEEQIRKLIDWCHSGPPTAEVERVEIKYFTELKNFKDFESVRGNN